MSQNLPGYHLINIEKGCNGEPSKIIEEIIELIDAESQNAKIMALIELSDLLGAIELYVNKYEIQYFLDKEFLNAPPSTSKQILFFAEKLNHSFDNETRLEIIDSLFKSICGYIQNKFKGISLEDILIMKNITKRAFINGRR